MREARYRRLSGWTSRTGDRLVVDTSRVASFAAIRLAGPIELNAELPGRTRLARWKLLRVFDFTERNLGGSIRVADLANVASLSVSHFTRAFRRSVGITPRVFVLERRIVRAKALMLSTQDSLSSIASACGLTDQSHFTRRFRQVVGLTPKRWRRQQRSALAEHPRTNGDRSR